MPLCSLKSVENMVYTKRNHSKLRPGGRKPLKLTEEIGAYKTIRLPDLNCRDVKRVRSRSFLLIAMAATEFAQVVFNALFFSGIRHKYGLYASKNTAKRQSG